MPRPSYRVWDPLVRVLHWTLVLSVAAAWFTQEGFGRWHEWIGYASLAIIAVRVAWGFGASPYARFAQFVRGPRAVLDYTRQVTAHREPRYLGHNPLGGWMIIALIAAIVATGASGWLYTTDAWWGVKWVEEVHDAFATLLVVLVAFHVAGVVVTSFRHKENLAGAMVHGRKRPPQSTDVA